MFDDVSRILPEVKYKKRIWRRSLKVLTPKQMLQRLPIALAKVKAGNTSENLLNKMRQIMHSLYRANEITQKVYNNLLNSTKV